METLTTGAIATLATLALLGATAGPEKKGKTVAREIAELHDFFQAWFRAHLPDTDEAFGRFAEVMAPEFVLVRPDGTESTRPQLMKSLRAAHGSDPSIEFEVENVSLIAAEGDLLVARYEELQRSATESTRRLSTVVFRVRDGTPNGLEWVRVHETWVKRVRA